MNKLATILLCANFITVLFPQPGYIHPDEFFQSSEIVAGDILKVKHSRAWEFNESFPVRSIVFPYLVISPSMYLLRWLNSTGAASLQLSAVKVVTATRLPQAFLSVIGYLATGKLASVFGIDKYFSTVLFCSSYVCWTYLTRTFSNSVEAALFAVVLLLVLPGFSSCKTDSDQLEKKSQKKKTEISDKEQDEDKDPSSTRKPTDNDISDTAEHDNREDTDESDDKIKDSDDVKLISNVDKNLPYVNNDGSTFISFLLGVVVVAGFFNRPTFLVFVLIPMLFWIRQVFATNRFFSHLFCLIIGSLSAFSFFVGADTFYFNPKFTKTLLSIMDHLVSGQYSANSVIESVQVFTSSLVVTPWNFIKYNTDSSNLAEHGIHSRFTHFFVNLPLLAGPLYLVFVISCVLEMLKLTQNQRPKGRNTLWLVLMVLVPVLCLSVFPHQEPRFLIPILPVLVVMGARMLSKGVPGRLSFIALWIFFNLLLTVVYGYMHQAALIPALSIYQQKLSSIKSSLGEHHAIFYKTYPPPRHLLLLDSSNTQVSIHDLAGAPVNKLLAKIKEEKKICTKSKSNCYVYIFLPSPVMPQIQNHLSGYKVSTSSICPHLSIEAPPRFQAWWNNKLSFDDFIMDFCLNILKIT
ncbi:GPI mannosyltransferase 4-like [Physella acuta]|uniref:GPI mannosyltransferase 4-like n=1 Tax=Physella acuta TaxID=109671 RepID=UPI0027DDABE1|nr:GPI mannosyltransferase 4-like [Physella acuta]